MIAACASTTFVTICFCVLIAFTTLLSIIDHNLPRQP